MTDDRYAHLREFYEHFASQDVGALRVGHRSLEAQLVRFEVLLDAFDPAHQPNSVLDVGCGVGDLYGYLQASDRLTDYLGIDILPDMVDEARRRYPGAEFVVGDILDGAADRRFDVVVSSGTLNIAVDDHQRWVQDMLGAMWERTDRALAFNFTSARAYRFEAQARLDEDIRYLDVPLVLEWSQTMSPWVTLRQDYMARDATIYIYRGYHRSASAMRDRSWTVWTQAPEHACTLAAIYTERGLAHEALNVLVQVEATGPVLLARGAAHQSLREFSEARECYRLALEADPALERASRALHWLDNHGL